MRVVDSKEMRELEKRAEERGIPTLLLMENAAKGLFNEIRDFVKTEGFSKVKIFILCGRGNNGGDGLALARHLFNHGYDVKVGIIKGNKPLTADGSLNYNIAKSIGIKIFEIESLTDEIKDLIREADLIVDALLGTGIKRDLEGVFLELVRFINGIKKDVIAVDIPSGIDSDSGKALGDAIRAKLTVALGLIKIGHLLFPGREYCGSLRLVDISFPPDCKEDGQFNIILEEEVKKCIKRRALNSHKGNLGHTVIIGGSKGKMGAPLMASISALRSGAGLLTAIIPEEISIGFQTNFPEIMTYPINNWKKDESKIIDFIRDKDAIVIGCGLGISDDAKYFFFDLLKNIDIPIVIDADGINLLAGNLNILKDMKIRPVLTPHIGEMARLLGMMKDELLLAPHHIAMEFSKAYNVYLVLKSATTIFTTPEEKLFFSIYGNPGMATAGSGDILAGIIGSFLGQAYDTETAVKISLALHGLAGDLAKLEKGENSLVASDIIDNISKKFKDWEER